MKIPVYIAISKKFDCIKGMTEQSILKNAAHPENIEIHHVYPKVESGCTGFSDVRFTIKHGIYLDPDMVVLGDIEELWSYRIPGRNVVLQDGSTEVMIIDGNHSCKNKKELYKLKAIPKIPLEWNVEDFKYFPNKPLPENIKLFHFTSLPHQPWFYEHPHQEALKLYDEYKPQQEAKKKRGRPRKV